MPTDQPDLTTFKRKLAEKRIRDAELKAQKASKEAFDSDLVPSDEYNKSSEFEEMNKIIKNIDILEAYKRWCGKMTPVTKGNQVEGVKISCPVPSHPDKNPSAWINLDKQTWFCGGCQLGGDTYDLAAFHFNYPVPEYKKGAKFHELRKDMAKDFGYVFTQMPGNVTVVTAPEASTSEPEEEVELKPEVEAEIVNLFDDSDLNILLPTLDWKSLVPKETFLDAYMQATIVDDLPEEYHFWNGLLALGFALGRDVRLKESTPVFSNLFICTLGSTGSGKSRAKGYLDQLLLKALPYKHNEPKSKGVLIISAPASAEALIHGFDKTTPDPTNPNKEIAYSPVRGLVDFNELSSLMARTNRMGSALLPTLMQFYDMGEEISTVSVTHKEKKAHQAFASTITTSQPKSLRDMLKKSDTTSGFLNRWIFVSGKEKKRVAIGKIIIDMSQAVKPLQNIFGWAGSFTSSEYIEYSDEADKKFTKFFDEVIKPDQDKDETQLLKRTDLLMKKLMLLFTANRMLKVIPVEAVDEAIACYDYIVKSFGITADQIGNTLTDEIDKAVMYHAKREYDRSKKGVTLRMLSRSLAKRKYPRDLLIKTVDNLVKVGLLTIEQPREGVAGRPTIRYKYAGEG